MSSFDKITEIIECESITARLGSNSVFNLKKKGFIRLIKDHHKRSYILELYNQNQKLCISLNVNIKL